MSVLASNRRAGFDYEILETYEAGIQLTGYEVKSARAGHIQMAGSFVVVRNREAFLIGAAISPYQASNTPAGYDPARSRKLLLHAREIQELIGKSAQKGLTIVPLSLYTKKSRIKLSFALARRKKKYDKREVIRKRDDERKMNRALRES